MKQASVFLSGLLFGFGLIISGMANPAKVLNFLDISGSWDPSLAFVMGGAILVTGPGYYFLRRARSAPLFADVFHIPTRTDIPPKLLIGAAIFGMGWGIGGFCPGPALASLFLAKQGTLVFVPSMLLGLYLGHLVSKLSD